MKAHEALAYVIFDYVCSDFYLSRAIERVDNIVINIRHWMSPNNEINNYGWAMSSPTNDWSGSLQYDKDGMKWFSIEAISKHH